MKKQFRKFFGILTFAALIAFIIACQPIAGGPGVAPPPPEPTEPGTTTRNLSHWLPSLAGNQWDTTVYIIDSGVPGANLLLVGGTHGNETAGWLAAERFVEYAVVTTGRAYVIPRLNEAAIAANNRRTPHQYHMYPGWQDPPTFSPPGSNVILDGNEARNVNRAYPGSDNMGLTQRLALAVMNLLYSQHIHIAIDMHEAVPSSTIGGGLAWTIIAANQNGGLNVSVRNSAVASLNNTNLMAFLAANNNNRIMETRAGISQEISHSSWGAPRGALAFLTETGNPNQIASGPTPAQLAAPHHQIDFRVAVQLEAVRFIVQHASAVLPVSFAFTGIPVFTP